MKRSWSIRRRTNTSSASTNETGKPVCPLDPLVNKTVEFAYRGARLKFDLSHALFSSYDIDAGTRLLLKEIASEPAIVEAGRVLDAGCGTGVIGISLAASCPAMDIVMRDRDLRAVAFAARNARRNGCLLYTSDAADE
ncbi:MAG: class I SAM-dependent methyltransferase, partial [Rectinema sp.]|nr:class I SAM-dependent methyltransferase [Rectinema sp.]